MNKKVYLILHEESISYAFLSKEKRNERFNQLTSNSNMINIYYCEDIDLEDCDE